MFQVLIRSFSAIFSVIAAAISAPLWIILRSYMGWRTTLFMICMWLLSPTMFIFVNDLNAQFHQVPPFNQVFFDMWWYASIPFIGYQLLVSFIGYFQGVSYSSAGRWILVMPKRADFIIVLLLSGYFFFTNGELVQLLIALYTSHEVTVPAVGFFKTFCSILSGLLGARYHFHSKWWFILVVRIWQAH